MLISKISLNNKISSKRNNDLQSNKINKFAYSDSFYPSFKGADKIAEDLFKKGIECDFAGNNLVAECTQKTVDIFSKIFGKEGIPDVVRFVPFGKEGKDAYAWFKPFGHTIEINADKACFYSMKKLTDTCKLDHYYFNFHPTTSYLDTFVHEFAHCTHYNHLNNIGKGNVWNIFSNWKMPTLIGKALGWAENSAYGNTDLLEFMAERITKDVCNNITPDGRFIGNLKTFDYAHIADGKKFAEHAIGQPVRDTAEKGLLNLIVDFTMLSDPYKSFSEEFIGEVLKDKIIKTPETVKNFSDIYAQSIWNGELPDNLARACEDNYKIRASIGKFFKGIKNFFD